MASSKLELLRSAFESVENSEKVLAIAYQNRNKFLSKASSDSNATAQGAEAEKKQPESVNDAIVSSSKAVWWDMLIKDLTESMHRKSREVIQIYEDRDGSLKAEHAAVSATSKEQNAENDTSAGSVWDNFYSKLDEVDKYHARYDSADAVATQENYESEVLFAHRLDQVLDQADRIFSGEEGHGRFLDLHKHYFAFCRLSKLRKLGLIKSDDYLSWLQNFDKFQVVPLYLKQTSQYGEYLSQLVDYLKDFIRRAKPLLDFEELRASVEEMFDGEWDQRSLFGWETAIAKIYGEEAATAAEGKAEEGAATTSLHCQACKKSFSNQNVFEFHLKGKRHIKAAAALATTQQDAPADLTAAKSTSLKVYSESQILRLQEVARCETWVLRLRSILNDVFEQTQNQVRKKQSSSYAEIEAEKDAMNAKQLLANQVTAEDSDDDDDRVKYNPKNLPMGWDGKPIPYWLFKLHGLGKEFKCEICGGASYWGRRAFEKHFQDWRHAYKMKCLGIPNTIHFKDVTEIEHALALHKKILIQNFDSTFKPDFQEEFEDQEGNLYSRKQYIDMKRQGLI